MMDRPFYQDKIPNYFQTQFEMTSVQVVPKCQVEVKFWYLLYRWLMFFSWTTIIICSIFKFGSNEPTGNIGFWFIYFTNWTLTLGTSQALLGAIIVTRRKYEQAKVVYFNAHEIQLTKTENLYFVLYVVTSTLAIAVTMTYWIIIYDPQIHEMDLLNVMVHVCNSLLMMMDFFVTGVPFEFKAFWWCPIIMCTYIVFNFSYYAAGGLDKHGNHFVYAILDWHKSDKAVLFCIEMIVFLILVHCALCCLAKIRDCMYRRMDIFRVKNEQ